SHGSYLAGWASPAGCVAARIAGRTGIRSPNPSRCGRACSWGFSHHRAHSCLSCQRWIRSARKIPGRNARVVRQDVPVMPNPPLESIPVITSADELDAWFAEHGATESECWVAFHKKTSPNYSVSLEELIDVGFCHGWVDNKGIRVDDDLRALRFT